MLLVWDTNAWENYLWWQTQDRKVLKRIMKPGVRSRVERDLVVL